jgi:ssDNA-binding Zn-finger/Zn-ribbon topoisomerase 1
LEIVPVPIFFDCSCGAKLHVADSAAGQTVTCRKCQKRLTVPLSPAAGDMTCPGCGTKLRVANPAVGKRYKCPKCHKLFRVPKSSPSRPAAATPAAAAERLYDMEVVEDDEVVESPPAVRRTRRDEEDDDGGGERPRRSRRLADDDDREVDFDDDDVRDRRLVRCPDCDKRISRKARACPFCGAPVAATTIEQTGKLWKAIQLAGGLLLVVGAGLGAVACSGQGSPAVLIGSILAGFFGVVGYAVGRTGAWWFHG